jgi:hypothetical protein
MSLKSDPLNRAQLFKFSEYGGLGRDEPWKHVRLALALSHIEASPQHSQLLAVPRRLNRRKAQVFGRSAGSFSLCNSEQISAIADIPEHEIQNPTFWISCIPDRIFVIREVIARTSTIVRFEGNDGHM